MIFKINTPKNDLIYSLILLVAILVFVLIKLPYLSLGYFWDEAWSYAPAVRLMHLNGLSLLPDAVPPLNSRGHPLLFYFLSASWIKLFGSSFVAVHSFCLLVSVLTIISLFILAKKLISNEVAILSVLVFMSQQMFLAQSGLLLPEVMLTLFSLLTILGILQSNKILYLISGSLLVMTKETGIVLIGTSGLWTIIEHFFIEKEKINLNLLKKLGIVSVPLLIIGSYLIIQKKMLGWFLYPEHVGLMTLNWTDFKSKFVNCAINLFISQNKRGLTLSLFLFVPLIIFFRPKCLPSAKKLCFFVPLFILFYFAFSAANFLTPRYLLCLIPLYIVVVVTFAYYALKNKILLYLFCSALMVIAIVTNRKENDNSDINLNYKYMCILQQKMVNYCISKGWQKKYIYTSFLNVANLKEIGAGYLGNNAPFEKVSMIPCDSTEYWIFFLLEENTILRDKLKQSHKIQLLDRIEEGNFWYEFYKTIN